MYNTFDNRRVNIRMKKSKLNKKLDKIKSIKSSKRGIHMSSLMDSYDAVSFFNGLVFFAPVSLLVRTQAGVSQSMFFLLQALLSAITFLGEIPTGFLTDRIGYKRSLVLFTESAPSGTKPFICQLSLQKSSIVCNRSSS